jgi:hypothetical protein
VLQFLLPVKMFRSLDRKMTTTLHMKGDLSMCRSMAIVGEVAET